jgi:hypothetical protein
MDDSISATTEEAFIQKKDTTDFEVLRNLARTHGLDFWIFYNGDLGGWVIAMVDPSTIIRSNVSLTFAYGGPAPNLMQVDLEYGLPNTPSEIKAWVWDPSKNDWEEVYEEETKEGKKQKKDWDDGAFTESESQSWLGLTDKYDPEAALVDMTKFRLSVAGYGRRDHEAVQVGGRREGLLDEVVQRDEGRVHHGDAHDGRS